MKIAGLTRMDAWFPRLVSQMTKKGLTGQRLEGVPVENRVLVESVGLMTHGPSRNYRPYLEVAGVLVGTVPETELPYGIDEVTFKPHPGVPITAFYEFSDEQLARLAMDKGFFDEGFEVPHEMTGIEWELPGTCDFYVVAPSSFESVPLVLVVPREQTEAVVDMVSSGYDLVEYFRDVRQPEAGAEFSDEPQRIGELEVSDIFEDMALEQPEAAAEAVFREDGPQEEAEQGEPSTFDELVADQALRRKRKEERAEREAKQSTSMEALLEQGVSEELAALYLARVAENLDKALMEAPEPEPDDVPEEAAGAPKARTEADDRASAEQARRAIKDIFETEDAKDGDYTPAD